MDAPSLSYGRFVANVLAGAGGRIAAIATAFVLSTVLVHALGLAIYGTWAFFFVLIGYSGQFDLGLSVAVERAVARTAADGRPDRIEELRHPLLDVVSIRTTCGVMQFDPAALQLP